MRRAQSRRAGDALRGRARRRRHRHAAGDLRAGAIVVTTTGAELRGGDAIASTCLGPVVAEPSRLLQAGHTALVLGPRTITVARRGHDGLWRYAISVLDR